MRSSAHHLSIGAVWAGAPFVSALFVSALQRSEDPAFGPRVPGLVPLCLPRVPGPVAVPARLTRPAR